MSISNLNIRNNFEDLTYFVNLQSQIEKKNNENAQLLENFSRQIDDLVRVETDLALAHMAKIAALDKSIADVDHS